MAAAVALGIFFTGTSDKNSNLIDINPGTGLVAESAVPAESIVPAEKTPVSSPDAAKTVAPAESVVSAASPVDPFAVMAFEDSRKSANRKASLRLLGGTTTNNAASGGIVHAAPGAYIQSGVTETSQSNYGIPFELGLGVNLRISDRFAIGTGVDYALLTRSFSGVYTQGLSTTVGDFNHSVQYIGIPVDLFVDVVRKEDFTLYTNAGIEAEYAISNKYHLLGTDTVVGGKVNSLQWSVGLGLGLEFQVGSRLGIFAEPTVKYYFDCGQPKSIRTDKPLQMTLRAGLRFDL